MGSNIAEEISNNTDIMKCADNRISLFNQLKSIKQKLTSKLLALVI